MNVLFCNERFLFRFGVDRILLILAKGLRDKGHNVIFAGNKFDYLTAHHFADRVIELPEAPEYLYSNEFCSEFLAKHWTEYFSDGDNPDLILIGGWPFFSSIPFLKSKCTDVIFLDCGAVPLDGFAGGALITQNKVREMRKLYLKSATRIIAISDFIAQSQSLPDTNRQVSCTSILLGSDHMALSIWSGDHFSQINGQALNPIEVNLLDSLRVQNRKIILNLGRWEPGCYKNSEAVFDIVRRIIHHHSDVALLILTNPEDISIPADLTGNIFPIGFPDDSGLQQIMKESLLGLSVSLWEGFNLPLAEMQWLNRPALAFNLAAHPEVIIHPWYLCQNNEEMAEKSCQILRGQGLSNEIRQLALERFHSNFNWSAVFSRYHEVLFNAPNNYTHLPIAPPPISGLTPHNKLPQSADIMPQGKSNLTLFVDVTNATKDTANSGVIRVTRRISQELQQHADIVFVVWDDNSQCYVLPNSDEFTLLSQYNGPRLLESKFLSPSHYRTTLADYLNNYTTTNPWLLFTETVAATRAETARNFARINGIKTAAIFYDAIPVLYPELCKDKDVRDNHAAYMRGLSDCDVTIPISSYSGQCLVDFWDEQNLPKGKVKPNLLPGEFGGYERKRNLESVAINEIQILCVSTLEPRKNHRNLIEACLLLNRIHPELNWKLTLVGNRYAGADDIAQYVQSVSDRTPEISWAGVVDDDTLHRLYQQATFTVYPSIIEGFGMPILESIWHGKPCICHEQGVMAELAGGGGGYTTDVTNVYSLASAIYLLCTDSSLRQKLSQEAVSRNLKSWTDYAEEFIHNLLTESFHSSHNGTTPNLNIQASASLLTTSYKDFNPTDNCMNQLYSGCLLDNWQMNDSERLALMAILQKTTPRCSIEIGTYKGGSLSLISQYSDIVFSVDIDPEIPSKFNQFKNVRFLTGDSSSLVPILLKELDETGTPVEFILIDGDHSADGIKKDVSWLVNYIPKRPLFVVMHDSFNPDCRRGMLEAEWSRSPYLKYIDLDFIPGRVIEHGGGGHGEMWGGLALAYFTPFPSFENRVSIKQSSQMMFTRLMETFYLQR